MATTRDGTMLRSMSRKSLRLAVKSHDWQPTQSEWLLASRCVQQEEKDRIGRYVFKKDGKSAMVGRLLIRAACSQMLDIPYPDIKLSRTEKGKPYLLNPLPPDYANFSFNISHQGEYVVLAAEKDREVGIDVMNSEAQRGDSISKFFSLMKRHLTDHEWTTVTSQKTERDQMRMFYRHWCLKESVVKTMGIGIGYEIGKLDFNLPTTSLSANEIACDTTVCIEGKLDRSWSFEETIIDDHCVAVAIRNQNNNNSSSDSEIYWLLSFTKNSSFMRVCLDSQGNNPFHILLVPELLKSCCPLPDSKTDLDYWTTFTNKNEKPVRVS